MGWTATRGSMSIEGVSLFAILALWQIPHFMAIAWMYKEDYARAGFKMLPLLDPDGSRTGRQGVAFAAALLVVSACPFVLHLAGFGYLIGAVLLGVLFLWFALQFWRETTLARARHLFYMSIVYLPLLLVVMVLSKVK